MAQSAAEPCAPRRLVRGCTFHRQPYAPILLRPATTSRRATFGSSSIMAFAKSCERPDAEAVKGESIQAGISSRGVFRDTERLKMRPLAWTSLARA